MLCLKFIVKVELKIRINVVIQIFFHLMTSEYFLWNAVSVRGTFYLIEKVLLKNLVDRVKYLAVGVK